MKGRSSVVFSAYAKLSFKMIIVGDKNVGKTSLILRYVKGSFSKPQSNATGIEFYSNTVEVQQEQVALQMWDTAGSDHFKTVTKSFYQQSNCILIVYSDPATAKKTIEGYLLEINEFAHQAVKVMITRTKIDEISVGEEEKEMLEDFEAREEGVVLWAAVSAKTGEGVETFFRKAAEVLFDRYESDQDFKEMVDPKKDSFMLSPKRISKQPKNSCCK